MATPKPVYCMLCGCFTGKHVLADDNCKQWGHHMTNEECIGNLANLIADLQERVDELESKLADA